MKASPLKFPNSCAPLVAEDGGDGVDLLRSVLTALVVLFCFSAICEEWEAQEMARRPVPRLRAIDVQSVAVTTVAPVKFLAISGQMALKI